METINIDGRFLIMITAIALLLFAIITQTLNIWLENKDHRRARGWDNEKCKQNFLDWLALKVAANPFFKKVIISFLIPFIVVWLLFRYPNLFFKKAYYHFEKQINSALDYLRR